VGLSEELGQAGCVDAEPNLYEESRRHMLKAHLSSAVGSLIRIPAGLLMRICMCVWVRTRGGRMGGNFPPANPPGVPLCTAEAHDMLSLLVLGSRSNVSGVVFVRAL
jgi:hypothetical protein